jgi:hypothetical protein
MFPRFVRCPSPLPRERLRFPGRAGSRLMEFAPDGSQGSSRPVPSQDSFITRPGPALDNGVIQAWHSTLEFELRSVEPSPPKPRPEPGSAPGSTSTTTPAGTPRWA